ncbi:hypothetical protein L5515_016821 [Caenorhabditis briggsae]|uniref:Uncharacterized protein n=1 Tax=Caenorhabditis briggsae TaxID=6238 RepID=A0AAE9FD74_CAEBR|nr:hypothetical protein L5515_016821 [Caenorhabditis briggsae]
MFKALLVTAVIFVALYFYSLGRNTGGQRATHDVSAGNDSNSYETVVLPHLSWGPLKGTGKDHKGQNEDDKSQTQKPRKGKYKISRQQLSTLSRMFLVMEDDEYNQLEHGKFGKGFYDSHGFQKRSLAIGRAPWRPEKRSHFGPWLNSRDG